MIEQKIDFTTIFKNELETYKTDLHTGVGKLIFKTKIIKELANDDIKIFVKKLGTICKQYESIIQIFNSKMIIAPEHLMKSIIFAQKAFVNKSNISKTMEMEYLLYSSLQRQISVALNRMGFKLDTNSEGSEFTFIMTSNNEKNLQDSFKEIVKILNADDISDKLSIISKDGLSRIMKIYEISEFELQNASMIDGSSKSQTFAEMTLEEIKSTLLKSIDEKLALLSIQNIKS